MLLLLHESLKLAPERPEEGGCRHCTEHAWRATSNRPALLRVYSANTAIAHSLLGGERSALRLSAARSGRLVDCSHDPLRGRLVNHVACAATG